MQGIFDTIVAPFRGNALGVNLFFAVVFGTIAFVVFHINPLLGLVAIPAIAILGPWFLQYCLLVGQQAAYARREPPALRLATLDPLPLGWITLGLGMGVVYEIVSWALAPAAGGLAVGLIGPVVVCALVAGEGPLEALNPARVADYLGGLGLAYPVLVLFLGASVWLCAATLDAGLGVYGTVFALQSVIIATFFGVGRLMLTRETAIGYSRPETPAERDARRAAQADTEALERALSESYNLAEVGRHKQALEVLLAHVRERDEDPGVYQALVARALDWRDPTVGAALARHSIARLERLGRVGDALGVFLRAHAVAPEVRPFGERSTLRLARRAAEASYGDVALDLLADFEERFPDSVYLTAALTERARLLAQHSGDFDGAAELLARIERERPQVAERRDLQRLRRIVGAAGSA